MGNNKYQDVRKWIKNHFPSTTEITEKLDFENLRNQIKKFFPNDEEKSKLFENCFFNTLDTCIWREDGSVFSITGDIPAMWLRDSSTQLLQYLHFTDDPSVCALIKGVIKTQVNFLIYDTYANAFMNSPYQVSEWDGKYLTDRWGKLVWERKFELDSLCYPLFLATKYYEKTQDESIFDRWFLWAFEQIKRTIKLERKHSELSTYYCRFWCNKETTGKDCNPEEEKGLVWSGYRPSDDKCKYHYHIPDNMFLVSVLYKLSPIFKKLGQIEYAEYCDNLCLELKGLIEEYGTTHVEGLGKIYVSETNCLGDWHADDDANFPSLLSIPYLEYPFTDKEVYDNTRKYVLSKSNKNYFKGKVLEGIGSPHTPANRVWPLAIAMQGLTSENEAEIKRCFELLIASSNGEGLMHEGVDVDDVSVYSRPWFAWANSMFADFVLRKADVLKALE